MSNAAVPTRPEPAVISRLAIGQPLKAFDARHWNSELLFLLCHNVSPVVSQEFPYSGSGTDDTLAGPIRVAYNRSPGVHVLYVEVEMGYGFAQRVTLEVTASSGSIGHVGDGQRLTDGEVEMMATPAGKLDYHIYYGYLDVSALTVGTTIDLIFTTTQVAGSLDDPPTIRRLHVVEVPLANVAPVAAPTTEMGVSGAWTLGGAPIVDGDTTTSEGMVRLYGMLDKARSGVRRYFQLNCGEGNNNGLAGADTANWSITSTTPGAAFPWGLASGANPSFKGKARHLYTVSPYATADKQPEVCQIRVRHSSSQNWTLRCTVTPAGGSPADTDISITSSGDAWAAATGVLNLPTTGTDEEFTIQFKAWNATNATPTFVSQIAIYTNET